MIEKYYRWHCQSFTDDNQSVQWCPAQSCKYGAMKVDLAHNNVVDCLCGHSFCFKCGREQHRPVDCEMAENWAKKNSKEDGKVDWIHLNIKMCPNSKCRRPIEKNQGCNQMKCKLCGYQFCWLCLEEWRVYSGHDWYKCNKFVKDDSKQDQNLSN